MKFKRVKTTFFTYSLVLALILTFVIFLNTVLSPMMDRRLIHNLLYFGAVNFIILIGLAFLSNYHYKTRFEAFKKHIFFLLTTIYTFIFVFMSVVYFINGQVVRIQTLAFFYKTLPPGVFIIGAIIIFFALILLSFLMGNVFPIKETRTMELKWSKIFFYGALFALLTLVIFAKPIFDIKDPLVVSYTAGKPILFEMGALESETLFNHKTPLESPNVVFVLLESITAEKLGFYGYERDLTPNLDAIAEKSTVFMNAYTTAPHSDYAQPGYLSSNYLLINDYRNFFLKPHQGDFLWDIFGREGYKTAYVSSQDDHWAGMNNYYNFDALDLYRYSLTDGEYDYGEGLAKKDLDERTINDALEWLNKSYYRCAPKPISNFSNSSYKVSCGIENEDPFLLYLNLQGTHNPYTFPENFSNFSLETSGKDDSENRIDRYDDSLKYVDSEVGRLLEYLEVSNIMNNTVIIIASDHGDDLYGRHNNIGHGYSLYDEEIKVPLIFFFPTKEPEIIDLPVSHIDVLPTVIDALGIPLSESFRGEPFKKTERIFFFTQNHKYLIGMLRGDLKVVIDLNRGLSEVYNLKDDPLELNNLNKELSYSPYIIELLTWHYCQLNYFAQDIKPEDLQKYCEVF
jgi:arylsulfatase A-like enzyme